MSKSNRSIIDKLCDLNPQKRLGANRQGFDGIKKHQWFSGFNWKAIAEHDENGVDIPIKPKVKSSTDFSNFDQDCISEETPAEKCSWNAEGF